MYKIFIVEDEYLMRYSLEMVINNGDNMKVVGTAENGQEALSKITALKPDIVLMDIRLPIMDGIACTKAIKELFPQIIVLILTTYNEDEYIYESLAYKANGYILKNISNQQLLDSIKEAAKGQFMMPDEVAAKLSERLHKLYDHAFITIKLQKVFTYLEKERNIYFTQKEKELVELLFSHLNNRQISDRLFISEGTVKNYLSNMYAKLSVKNRNDLVHFFKDFTSRYFS